MRVDWPSNARRACESKTGRAAHAARPGSDACEQANEAARAARPGSGASVRSRHETSCPYGRRMVGVRRAARASRSRLGGARHPPHRRKSHALVGTDAKDAGRLRIVGQHMNGSASHWRLPHRKEYRWAQRARGGMPLRTRGVPASQSALVRLVELCRAESALVRVPRRAHLHGGRIKMANDMQRDQWHGRREAAP